MTAMKTHRPRFTTFDPDAITVAEQASACSAWQPDIEIEDNPGGPGTSRPLTRRQKWLLADLGRHVFDGLRGEGKLVGVSLEDWRHHIAVKACGKRISQASLGDFKLLQAAFLHEWGDEEGERRALVQAASTPQAIALFKLREALKAANMPASYAETLGRRFYKNANLADLTARQLWTLLYTIRNNASKTAGKGNPDNRFKSRKERKA